MTITEALNSGKPFRRKPQAKKENGLTFATDDTWICYDEEKNGGWFFSVKNPESMKINEIEDIGTSLDLYKKELTATDWEIYIKE